MVAQKPGDSFLRYGLAMEYLNAGDLESAVREFDGLIAADPGYSASYFQAGRTLVRLGSVEEARGMYLRGIEVTARQGNQHAHSELQGALDLLG
jgi:Tfp pilus assembly protein PilF